MYSENRFSIVMQVCRVDNNGDAVECFTVQGPELATTDLHAAKAAADAIEAASTDIFRSNVNPDTITNLYPKGS